MKNDFLRVNIAIIPTDKVRDKAITLSQQIFSNNTAFFELDGIALHPHITLYAACFPENAIPEILHKVETLLQDVDCFDCIPKSAGGGQGYLGIRFNRIPDIQKLHEKIVNSINPTRIRYMKDEIDDGSIYKANLPQEEIENIKKYGYGPVLDRYSPHLTISRLKNNAPTEDVIADTTWREFQFTAKTIGVFRMEEHGTCRELLKDITLGVN
jgi:hypothetical protein